ncbi:hypothetical protein BJX70DRAFT_219191 [Aspergillus crustosus]
MLEYPVHTMNQDQAPCTTHVQTHTSCRQPPPRPIRLQRLRKYARSIQKQLAKLSTWRPYRRVRSEVPHSDAEPIRHDHSSISPQFPKRSSYLMHDHPSNDRPLLTPTLNLTADNEPHRLSASSHILSIDSHPTTPSSNGTMNLVPTPVRHDLDADFCEPLDIRVRLPGDAPDKIKQITASLDTQCKVVNLMRRGIWDKTLNEDGRLNLVPADENVCVSNLGSEPLPVIGIARNLEWYLKEGRRIYISDFHIVDMDHFDVLIGSKTINEYGLLRPGADLEEYIKNSARDERSTRDEI